MALQVPIFLSLHGSSVCRSGDRTDGRQRSHSLYTTTALRLLARCDHTFVLHRHRLECSAGISVPRGNGGVNSEVENGGSHWHVCEDPEDYVQLIFSAQVVPSASSPERWQSQKSWEGLEYDSPGDRIGLSWSFHGKSFSFWIGTPRYDVSGRDHFPINSNTRRLHLDGHQRQCVGNAVTQRKIMQTSSTKLGYWLSAIGASRVVYLVTVLPCKDSFS